MNDQQFQLKELGGMYPNHIMNANMLPIKKTPLQSYQHNTRYTPVKNSPREMLECSIKQLSLATMAR